MSSPLVNHEPIPGYRLIERLGRGGYGEVWKAEAPGGLFKAIKFVYGNLDSVSEEGKPAEQELKSLHRVKTIRHPYILSIERFDVVDGQLVIVMELADRNLWDRFTECRGQKLVGIPRDELLDYLEETAEALDLMNQHYQIQHLDVKPQNVFLVHNHVKVADFGLAKDFEGIRATVTGGVTPVYAAPETFEGWVSRYCDQYSLAIVYQELLTGVRPFSGSNARQLLMQHLSAEPNVAPLAPAEQAAIRRALSKKPDDRFPTCLDLVRAIQGRGQPPPSFVAPRQPDTPGLVANSPQADITATMLQRHLPRPSDSDRIVSAPTPASTRPAPTVRGLPALITPSSAQGNVGTPPRPGETLATPVTLQRPVAQDTGRLSELGIAPPERTDSGVLFPVLVVGIGGTGLAVLRRLRAMLRERFGGIVNLPNFRWLYIDTDPDAVQSALADPTPEAFAPAEVVTARLHRPAYYLRREGLPPTDNWLPGEILYRIPRHAATLGIRALGRLAFVDYQAPISQRVRAELESFLSDDPLTTADQSTGLGIRSNRPRVYLFASLAGGTGSGMLVDLAYTVRNQLRQFGWTKPQVAATCFLPAVEGVAAKPAPIANAYAALRELQHFGHPSTRYEVRFQAGEPAVVDSEPPLTRCAVVSLPRVSTARAFQHVCDLAAGQFLQECMTPIGRIADEARATWLQAKTGVGVPVQSFGLYRVVWPRARLLDAAVTRFRLRVISGWIDKRDGAVIPSLRDWVKEEMDRRELTPDGIQAQIEALAGEVLGLPAAEHFRRLIPLHDGQTTASLDGSSACSILENVLGLLGKPTLEESAEGTLNAALQLRAKELARGLESQLAEITARFVEEPGYRFQGAEQAVRYLITCVQASLDGAEERSALADKAAQQDFGRFLPLVGTLETGGLSLWGDKKGSAATELARLLPSYMDRRYRAIVLRALVTVYRVLLGTIPEYLREINFCRLQASELARRLADDGRTSLAPATSVDHPVLPQGCRNADEAAGQFVDSMSADELLEFERQFQVQLLRYFGGLVNVCLEISDHFQHFARLFADEARAFLDPRLEKATAAEAFFLHVTIPTAAKNDILKAYDESTPELGTSRAASESEVFVLAAPFDPAGERFRRLAREVLDDVQPVTCESAQEIVFYRECRNVPLTEIAQAGRFAREAAAVLEKNERISPYSRADVSWLPLPPE